MLPIAAQKIRSRIAVEDQKVIADAQTRIEERHRLRVELVEAIDECRRLNMADNAGRLNKEERAGWDDEGEPIVKKVRDFARLTEAQARVDHCELQLALLKSSGSVPRMTATRIDHELAKLSGKKLVEVARPKLALAKGETAADALPRIRGAALELLSELRETLRAPRTKDEVKAAMRNELNRLADAGLPKTLAMFHGAKIAWPERTFGEGRYHVPDGVALVAFLLRDELEAKLSKLIDFNASAFPGAMSADGKSERLAELDSEIDAAERLEAACVEQIIADGGTAHHRPDISVLAVLSLRAE